MKMRYKFMYAASAAAVLLVMIAVAALAIGVDRNPAPDVLAQPVQSLPEAEIVTVYSTDGAAYYHQDEHCSGMENAVSMPETEAVQMGKKPCPVCISIICNGHNGEEIESVYYSTGSKYFHKTEECSGGTFPTKGEYFAVTGAFPAKEPCTLCFPNGITQCLHGRAFVAEPQLLETNAEAEEYAYTESAGSTEEYASTAAEENPENQNASIIPAGSDTVFYTSSGLYYHSLIDCQGMENARAHSRNEARVSGKLPCPRCLLVYARDGGTYFHLLPDCMGMLYADLYTQNEAYAMGNQLCPLCLSPETVYATRLGKYFHADELCSGMQDAQTTTPEAEWANGKTPCPVCITGSEEVTAYNPENSFVYAAYGNPLYYHIADVCNGQQNKRKLTIADAEKEQLLPCPDCYAVIIAEENTETAEPVFYCTPNGKYYHFEPDCSGMLKADACTPEQAIINSGKNACPVCFNTEDRKALYMLPAPRYDTDEVYCSAENSYYHIDPNCFSVTSVSKMDLLSARDSAKTPCPVCLKEQADISALETCWSTKHGRYFHSDEYCSGMQNAISGLVEEARSAGKMRCPVCMKTTPENYDLFTTAFGQEIEDLYAGYIYDHSIGTGDFLSEWYISNGEETIKLCEIRPEGSAFFGEELPGLPELCLTGLATDPKQVHEFMKAAPTSIGSMYAAASAELEKQITAAGGSISAEELQLQEVTVYFDANRRVNACEMHFGFGDHVSLKWHVNTDGKIELIESEFNEMNWG